MVTRRGFLGMMLGAAAAPAIVKAENLMKIVVPKKELVTPEVDSKIREFFENWYKNINEHPDVLTQRLMSSKHLMTTEDGIIIGECDHSRLVIEPYDKRHVKFGNGRSYPINMFDAQHFKFS